MGLPNGANLDVLWIDPWIESACYVTTLTLASLDAAITKNQMSSHKGTHRTEIAV